MFHMKHLCFRVWGFIKGLLGCGGGWFSRGGSLDVLVAQLIVVGCSLVSLRYSGLDTLGASLVFDSRVLVDQAL